MKTYAEKLKDPRWQRKRLEIMARDSFACQVCQDETTTLHVHHIRYIKGREPWDYKDFYFVTLCETCHAQEESEIKEASNQKPKPQKVLSRFDELVDSAPEYADEESAEMNQRPTDEEMKAFFGGLQGMLSSIPNRR
jgi:peptidoglycan hydrolase CwlO-like protein